jgi:16S rRNA (uracil1498-N3)-methyltransferase
MLDRIEWMIEKATEVGVDEITFFHSKFSERRVVKIPRLEKIAISAMKQSHKAWKPVIHDIVSFKDFIASPVEGRKYIAHCYEEIPRVSLFTELQALDPTEPVTVLIGPEGDFSIDEVQMAIEAGYQSVHLGNSRLRTETAGLMAVTMMQLSKT